MRHDPRTILSQAMSQYYLAFSKRYFRSFQYLIDLHSCMLHPMPTIGIDCRFASVNTGLGTYVRELVGALAARYHGWNCVAFVRTLGEQWTRNLRLREIHAPYPHYSLSEQTLFAKLLYESGIDLFFSPQFNVPFLCPVPFVCSVHDLTLHSFPNHASFVRQFAYRFLFRHSVLRARHIFCPSVHTQTALLHFFPTLDKVRTSVTFAPLSAQYVPQSPDAQRKVRELFGLTGDFLLYVGNAKQHKNIPMLLDAFSDLCRKDLTLVLVMDASEAAHLVLADTVRIVSSVPLELMPPLYSAARLFVTPTLSEGFGLPLIEAMACGCPVVATNAGSIPEVTVGRALLVQPTRTALHHGMQLALLQKYNRTEIAEGWHRLYASEHIAERIVPILDSLVRTLR